MEWNLFAKQVMAILLSLGIGPNFVGQTYAQESDTPTAQGASDLERQANAYDKWSEDQRQSAQGWRADAATMRKVAKDHNNDKTAMETAIYYERRAMEIDTEADRLHQKAEQLRQEAQELRKQQPASDLTGFWQDSTGKITVHLAQSRVDLAMDLGNRIVLTGTRNGNKIDLKYVWTTEAVAKHIKSEQESGPQAQADRSAAMKALVGKTVALQGAVNDKADSINAFYYDNWSSDAETNRSGTRVRTESPSRSALTLHRKQSEPRCSSQTFATVPSDRSRHRVGIGEEVALKFSSEESVMGLVPQWSVSGNGRIRNPSGLNTVFIAGDRGGTAMITARASSGQTCSILFTVVEPSGVVMRQLNEYGTYHRKGFISAGFLGRYYVTPSDVSFYRIEMREGDADTTGTRGFGNKTKPIYHDAPAATRQFFSMGQTVEGLGTPELADDTVLINVPFSTGAAIFNTLGLFSGTYVETSPEPGFARVEIPVEYRVAGGESKFFAKVEERGDWDSEGNMTIRKGGAQLTTYRYDPDSIPNWAK